MARKNATLGELELDVLKVIWQRQPCTVQQVAEVLGEQRGYARTTILTVMQRLHRKKFLKRKKVAGAFNYSTTQQRSQVISRLIDQFVDKVLDGSPLPFVAYLTETDDLTDAQIAALRKITRQLEKNQKGGQK
jgi:predicted transcriptional regulator